ncbi:uncharacterized protein PHALS_01531 [Plasmopara halstedii]|uniref:Uncharacterized protein n=1 Tax=Plasmopara halstedii TaxID=4781 RepID=A0A0N7L6U1_PLAHL|nr:uncharacterized protein PHALS_01531 [Plasmopara halstedii]CEG45219.1 hypothetical protein PHALS_01531 [Plasmopara halstedii]|eukprot:XP_024581588.1 hypothetical protein PHALS_01531 [Plasmopara halstedii]
MRNTPELLAPSTKQHVTSFRTVSQVARKSSELAQALEHLVLNSVQQRLGDGSVIDNQTRCTCNCDVMWEQMEEMTMQILTLQNRVLELSKHSIPTAIEVSKVPSNGNWSTKAPPFVEPTVDIPLPPAEEELGGDDVEMQEVEAEPTADDVQKIVKVDVR